MGSISSGNNLGNTPLSSLGKKPMVVTVDGSPLKGQVNALKDGVSVEQAMAAGKKDGVDQVFVESNGKNYVIQGESLDIKNIKKSDFAQIYIGDTPARAEIKGIDNESNTIKEGAWNLGTKIGVGGAVASVALAFVGTALEKSGPGQGGYAMGGLALAGISTLVAGVSAVGGATVGALKGSDVGLKNMIQQN